MHKLIRTEEPVELTEAREAQATHSLDWEGFSHLNNGQNKHIVQDALLLMQNFRCAYCECALNEHEGHIEHFRRKNPSIHPELTFVWSNLFYSCQIPGNKTSHIRCGISKDEQYMPGFNYGLLIDPCVDNPEDFLVFTKKGYVYPKTNLSDTDRLRAETTIKMFNLNEHDEGNEHNLVVSRKNAIKKYKWLKDIIDKNKIPIAEIDQYLDSIKNSEPFVTAIFHYFGRRVVE
ncbi:MAG: TIGR02646 family protein [Victivallales bacterium]|nr:TIGR02646 family protein [Victivallales bacterium]